MVESPFGILSAIRVSVLHVRMFLLHGVMYVVFQLLVTIASAVQSNGCVVILTSSHNQMWSVIGWGWYKVVSRIFNCSLIGLLNFTRLGSCVCVSVRVMIERSLLVSQLLSSPVISPALGGLGPPRRISHRTGSREW